MTDVPVTETPRIVIVLPAIAPDLAHSCVESLSPILRSRTLLIDNSGTGRIAHNHEHRVRWTLAPHHNLGVSSSWNVGIRFAEHEQADYLIILSQSITFGRARGLDFLAELSHRRPSVFFDAQFGWKLIAVHTDAFRTVGGFDPSFDPVYYEESEWMYRAHLAGIASPWYNNLAGRSQWVEVDATSAGDGVSLTRGLVAGLDYGAQREKYQAKWHGSPREERTTHPYGLERLDWRFVGPPPEDAVPPPATDDVESV